VPSTDEKFVVVFEDVSNKSIEVGAAHSAHFAFLSSSIVVILKEDKHA
jgi:hypothetical protein